MHPSSSSSLSGSYLIRFPPAFAPPQPLIPILLPFRPFCSLNASLSSLAGHARLGLSQITSFNLHFRQGTADSVLASEDFGAYEGLTFWEQVEAGVPWTSTKKFFMVAPLVLVYLAGAECNFEPTLVAVNVFIMGFEIIPKFPGMHKVRLFGWNDQKVD